MIHYHSSIHSIENMSVTCISLNYVSIFYLFCYKLTEILLHYNDSFSLFSVHLLCDSELKLKSVGCRSVGERRCDEYRLIFYKCCSCNMYADIYTACITFFLSFIVRNRTQEFQGCQCRQNARCKKCTPEVKATFLLSVGYEMYSEGFNQKPVYEEHLHCRNKKFCVRELLECLCPDKLDHSDLLKVSLKPASHPPLRCLKMASLQ